MPAIERLPLTRRRLVQASAAALAAARLPSVGVAFAGDADGSDLVAGNTAFALDLYGEIRGKTDGNILVSPYSISLALAMTWAGAAGETADQMAETLSFDLDQADLPAAFGDLTADLLERGNAEEDAAEEVLARALSIANALWAEQTYPFSDDFMDALAEGYDAELQLVDFREEPEASRIEINDWVAENTNDRIQDIVPEGAITPDTRLVLANAIWFYGAWASQFDPASTSDGEFFLPDGTTATVPFMHQQEFFSHAEVDGVTAVELPYQGSGFAFTILMPEEGEFDAFEASLDADVLDEAFGALTPTEIRLSMPSFSFEYDTSLSEALSALGMEDAFTAGVADFSGMVDGETDEPLFISDVLHKAFIAVDENGTEAAAATVVIMEGASAAPSEPIEVRIDRPFVFAIRDTETGTLLFLGRVLSPES